MKTEVSKKIEDSKMKVLELQELEEVSGGGITAAAWSGYSVDCDRPTADEWSTISVGCN